MRGVDDVEPFGAAIREAVEGVEAAAEEYGYQSAEQTNAMTALVQLTDALPLSMTGEIEGLLRRRRRMAPRVKTEAHAKSALVSQRRFQLVSAALASLFPKPTPSPEPSSIKVLPWIDIADASGFAREEALRALPGGAPNAFFLEILLRRLNDWVPQVRAAARDAVPVCCAETDRAIVTRVLLHLLPHQTGWGRMEANDREVFFDLLDERRIASRLADEVRTAAQGPMKTALGQALRRSSMDPYLEVLSREAVQPAVRARAYAVLLAKEATWAEGREREWMDKSLGEYRMVPSLKRRPLTVDLPLERTLEAAIADPSPIVRRVGGDALVRQRQSLGPLAVRLAKVLAADDYPSIAERGRFVLANPSAVSAAPTA